MSSSQQDSDAVVHQRFIRQRDLLDRKRVEQLHVTQIGVGAIGSCTALSLAKLGISRFTLFDPQDVGVENLGNQLFRNDDLGKPKVEAVSARLFAEGVISEVNPIKAMFEGQELPVGPIILGVDSLEKRRKLWRGLPRVEGQLLIDARMGAEVAHIYAIDLGNPADRQRYVKSLQGEAHRASCTARGTVYTALGIGAFVTAHLKRWIMGQPTSFGWLYDFVNATAMPIDENGVPVGITG